MTREQIDSNRKIIIEELCATKRSGVDTLVEMMDRYDFFTARCHSHDDQDGGTANHSLWLLWFARQTRQAILKERPDVEIL